MKICPKCRRQFGDASVFCPGCGSPLQTVGGAVPPVADDMPTVYGAQNAQTVPINPNGYGNYTPARQQNNGYAGGYPPNPVYGNGGYPPNDPYARQQAGYGNGPVGQQPPYVGNVVSTQKKSNVGLVVGLSVGIGVLVIIFAVVLALILAGRQADPDDRDGRGASPAADTVTESATEAPTEAPTDPPTEAPTEAPTGKVVTQTQPPPAVQVPQSDDTAAFEAYNTFYASYLNAVNTLNKYEMTQCTPEVREEMAQRFPINSRVSFVLRRIDYDRNTVTHGRYMGMNSVTFYTKCVSDKNNRSTGRFEDYNYAIWKVTVVQDSSGYIVAALDRNDDYKLSSNVYTITTRY